MKVVIDTSSLVSFVRNFAPFDPAGAYTFIKSKIEAREIIILDEVLMECKYQSKGIVISTLDFLEDKSFCKTHKIPVKTVSILPPSPRKFLNMLNSQFTVTVQKKKLSEAQYEAEKRRWEESADAKLIIYALNHSISKPDEPVYVVTEETETANDNKVIKKIPFICRQLDIPVINLPEMLEIYKGIDLKFS